RLVPVERSAATVSIGPRTDLGSIKHPRAEYGWDHRLSGALAVSCSNPQPERASRLHDPLSRPHGNASLPPLCSLLFRGRALVLQVSSLSEGIPMASRRMQVGL